MKVIIWGCGDFGKRILPNLIMSNKYEIVAYTDNNERLWGQCLSLFPIIAPGQIMDKVFDMVLIVVSSPAAVEQIKAQSEQLGIPQDKVANAFVDLRFMDLFIDQRICFIKEYAGWIKKEKIEGNVAECGVFRGDSAKYINYYFPDRKLYLCDTFHGFDSKDMQYEKASYETFEKTRFSDSSFFVETGSDFVMQKMSYPENVVIRQGYFPESMQDVEEKFCFVNLDMDLYVPMLNGLHFFWDRMVSGGCILLHDYFSDIFQGVRQAVDTFEREREIWIPKTPIGDRCSLALLKN
ncbi:MAG: class I SAM-dependent methyltransferase [Lachnospiraceae bacterium]|nr:class I SAM-dependent methyltransferase [Lachnospiraceae bacterium]